MPESFIFRPFDKVKSLSPPGRSGEVTSVLFIEGQQYLKIRLDKHNIEITELAIYWTT